MDADDIRWSEAAMLWARHGQPRDDYDEAVFARLDTAPEAAGAAGPGLRPAWLDGDPDEDDPVTARWREAATRWSCGESPRDEYERQVSAQMDADAAGEAAQRGART